MESKELIFSVKKKDLDVQTYKASGPGGQHRNKTMSAVRILHRASGAVGDSSTDRSQHRNKRIALERLANSQKFRLWCKRKAHELTGGKTLQQRVDEAMAEKNLRIETIDEDGKWRGYDR